MQITKREASFLATALETKIKNIDLFHEKVESTGAERDLSIAFQNERKELLSKIAVFLEEV